MAQLARTNGGSIFGDFKTIYNYIRGIGHKEDY
jgi:hypothetical protein